MIEIRALSHSYGSLRALDRVTFDVPAGKIVGLVGPNGAGKTTLMRAVATLLSPTGGQVLVNGHDAAVAGSRVRAVLGYLPERATPYADLLVCEHLELFARIAGHTGPDGRRRVDDALARAGLGERRDSLVRELSKGLRQRLAIQAALLHDPASLVLDEPTDGLDPESREHVLREARGLADKGCAVLLSSHVLAEIEEVADQVVILVGGRVQSGEAPVAGLRIFLRVRGDVDLARKIASAVDGVVDVADEAGALRVTLAGGEQDGAKVAEAVVRGGLALVELREERESLKVRFRAAVDQQRGNPSREDPS